MVSYGPLPLSRDPKYGPNFVAGLRWCCYEFIEIPSRGSTLEKQALRLAAQNLAFLASGLLLRIGAILFDSTGASSITAVPVPP